MDEKRVCSAFDSVTPQGTMQVLWARPSFLGGNPLLFNGHPRPACCLCDISQRAELSMRCPLPLCVHITCIAKGKTGYGPGHPVLFWLFSKSNPKYTDLSVHGIYILDRWWLRGVISWSISQYSTQFEKPFPFATAETPAAKFHGYNFEHLEKEINLAALCKFKWILLNKLHALVSSPFCQHNSTHHHHKQRLPNTFQRPDATTNKIQRISSAEWTIFHEVFICNDHDHNHYFTCKTRLSLSTQLHFCESGGNIEVPRTKPKVLGEVLVTGSDHFPARQTRKNAC